MFGSWMVRDTVSVMLRELRVFEEFVEVIVDEFVCVFLFIFWQNHEPSIKVICGFEAFCVGALQDIFLE